MDFITCSHPVVSFISEHFAVSKPDLNLDAQIYLIMVFSFVPRIIKKALSKEPNLTKGEMTNSFKLGDSVGEK